ELLGLSASGVGTSGELLCAWRADGRRLDPVPAPRHTLQYSRGGPGHHPYARLSDPLHHRLHDVRVELCGDGIAGAHTGDDADAPALDDMGYFHGHRLSAASLPRPVRRRRHDVV